MDAGSIVSWVSLGLVLVSNVIVIVYSYSRMQALTKANEKTLKDVLDKLKESDDNRYKVMEKLIHMEAELNYIKKELDMIAQQNKVVRTALITKALSSHVSNEDVKELQS